MQRLIFGIFKLYVFKQPFSKDSMYSRVKQVTSSSFEDGLFMNRVHLFVIS